MAYTNKDIIKQTLDEISKEAHWKERYAGYAKDLLKNVDHYKEMSRKVNVRFPLSAYTTITKLKKSKYECEYDIRYLGYSIGSLFIGQDSRRFKHNGYEDLIKKYSSIPRLQEVEDWGGTRMSDFRKFLSHINMEEANTFSPEHKCENLLLREFHKGDSKNKSLKNIQPITFGGKFVQLTTILKASKKDEVSYSKIGGGIDILARARHNDNKVYLTVFELKDQNKSSEPMSVVIQQALSYAVFVAQLLDSPSGSDWLKIFGFNGRHPKVIDVVGLIPKGKETIIEEEYDVGNYKLRTHSLYYDKDALLSRKQFSFSGSFSQQLLQ